MPGLSALNVKVLLSPGLAFSTAAPPPGPLTAWKSMLCPTLFSGGLISVTLTVSPSITRIIGPGTVPSNVQKSYVTPSASSAVTSLAVNVTEIPVAPGEEHWLLDTSLDEVYWPCSHSRAIPSFPSQLEWKIGLAWANT